MLKHIYKVILPHQHRLLPVPGFFLCAALCLIVAVIVHPASKPLEKILAGTAKSAGMVTVVSAASFEGNAIAPDSIVAAYGEGLATETVVPPATPLQTALGGTTVKVRDKNSVERLAQLFFVSSGQVNFLVPAATAVGQAIVTIRSGNGTTSTGEMKVAEAAPAIFTANGNGRGVPAAVLLRVRTDGKQVFEEIAKCDPQPCVPKPIDIGPSGEKVFLLLFVSGLRVPKERVRVVLDGIPLDPTYVGPSQEFVGLDQVNVEIPRDRVRRGPLSLWVQVESLVSSNITQIEIAFPQTDTAPQVMGFDASEVAAGQSLTISGANFSSDPAENSVVFVDKQIGCAQAPPAAAQVVSATDTEIKVIVPYGAASSQVSVRTAQGEGQSTASLRVKTSISGFVEDTQHKPVEGATVRLRLSGNNSCDPPNICVKTNAEGAFVLTGVPPGTRRFEVDGSPLYGQIDEPPKTLVQQARDNHYCGFLTLQRQNGICAGSGCGPNFLSRVEADSINPDGTNQAGNAVLDLPAGAIVRAQDGTIINKLNVAVFENGRAPTATPFGQFSQAIVQIMPLGATITNVPGAKLTFPNSDRLPAGMTARLYRFDLTLGGFVEAGAATVSADGQRVETAPNAITETSYYFVSIDRPTTTLYGHVVENDGQRPVRRALVVARGQYTFTDVNGGYTLRGLPVFGANDVLTIDVSVLRPDGRVDRAELRVNLPVSGSNPPIVMPRQKTNRPPVIIAPPELNLRAGTTSDFSIVIADPDRDDADPARPQKLEVQFAGSSFALLTPIDTTTNNGSYRLRLSPGANDTGGTLTITAHDSLGASATRRVTLKVSNPSGLTAFDQSAATDEDRPGNITLTVANGGSAQLSYQIVRPPGRGRLVGEAPNLFYLPNKDWNGLDSFTFKASAGATVSNTATVYLAVRPVNDLPVLDIPGRQFVNAGQILSFDVTVTEVDGDELIVTAQGVPPEATSTTLPGGAAFARVGFARWQFTWTPKIEQIIAQTKNDYLIRIAVSDGISPVQNTDVTITAFAQWAETSGIEGGNITALLATDSGLFAGTQDGGIYRSTNDGRVWTPVKTGLPPKSTIFSLGAQGGALFAGTREGVFRSLDNGESWWAISLEMDVATFIVRGTNLYAGGTAKPVSLGGVGNVAVSTDNGNSWKPASEGLRDEAVGNLAVNGTSLFAGTECRVFRYNDNLQKWEPTGAGIPVFCPQDPRVGRSYIFALAANGTNVFAGTSTQFGSNFFVSSTNGESWRSVDVPTVANVRAIALQGTNLYAGTEGGGVYVLANNGQSWRQINEGLPPLSRISKLVVTGASLYAGLQSGGVFVLPENSERWQPSNTGLTSSPVNRLAVVEGHLFAATDSSGVMVSTNNGQSWTARNNGLTNPNITALIFDGTNLFAGTHGSGVFVSTDKGQNWQTWGVGLPQDLQVRSLFSNGSDLFVGGQFPYGLFRSTNNGFTWRPVRAGLECPPSICPPGYHEVLAMAAIGSQVFAATGLGGVFYSDDRGESWKPCSTGPVYVYALIASGPSLFAATTKTRGDYPFSVFRSDDRGLTWKEVRVSGPPTHADSVPLSLFADGENIFLGTSNNGVFLSTDNGDNWKPFNFGAGRVECRSFAKMGDRLFVGTASGLVRLSNNPLSWTARNGTTNTPLAVPLVNTVLVNSANLLAGTLGGGVFRSDDQGQNWVPASGGTPNSLPPNANVRALVTSAGGTPVFAAVFGVGIFRSDDQGQNWTNVTGNLANKSINALAVIGQSLFAATDGGGVFRANYQGQNWTLLNGPSNSFVLTLAVNGAAIYAGTDGDGVFISTNNGDTWTPLSKNGLAALDVRSLAFSGKYIFAGTLSGGVFRSDNGGQSWAPVNGDLPLRLPVFALAVGGGKLFAGTVYGVFVLENDSTNWKQVNAGLLDVFVTSLAVSGNSLIAGTRSGGVFISQF